MTSTAPLKLPGLSAEQCTSLETKKIFFGHQSVGDNIIQGIRERMRADRRLHVTIVDSSDPQSVPAPAFVESHIGENRNPQSKDRDFAAVVGRGMGVSGGIAMYKYCYIDFDAHTDVPRLFDTYRGGISEIKEKYPLLKIVHVTVPLTTVEPAVKAWAKNLLGRATAREANARRNRFNALLRQTYEAADPIFDLAEAESTHPDGSRSYFVRSGEAVYTLAPEYTADGGHLNEAGRAVVADRLLRLLASL